MTSEYIISLANRYIKKYATRDPFELASHLGINIMMREDFTNLKGLYRVICKNRFIFINANLPKHIQNIVCAHELGHDQLHRNLSKSKALQEFMLYDMVSQPEYEANLFACSLLLSDDDILYYATQGYDTKQIASALGTDVNLVHIKLNCMAKAGKALCMELPVDSAFL